MEPFFQLLFYLFIAPFWLALKIIKFLWELGSNIHLKHQVKTYQDQKSQEKIKQQQKTREIIATYPCATCEKPVGLEYKKGNSTHIKTVDRYFCSSECHATACRSSGDFDLAPPQELPTPPSLCDDALLLLGKTSAGMHFDPGRCVNCGQALDSKTAEFAFCSHRCKDKAVRPFLPDDFHKRTIEDSYAYKRLLEHMEAFQGCSQQEYEEITREAGVNLTRPQYKKQLEDKIRVRQVQFEQQQMNDINSALHKFQENWLKQRAYILSREKAKETEKQTKENEKIQQQQAKERAKQDALDAEEAKWRPKKFEL